MVSFCNGKDKANMSEFSLPFSLDRSPKVSILKCKPPKPRWIKVNSDGLSKGNLGACTVAGV